MSEPIAEIVRSGLTPMTGCKRLLRNRPLGEASYYRANIKKENGSSALVQKRHLKLQGRKVSLPNYRGISVARIILLQVCTFVGIISWAVVLLILRFRIQMMIMKIYVYIFRGLLRIKFKL